MKNSSIRSTLHCGLALLLSGALIPLWQTADAAPKTTNAPPKLNVQEAPLSREVRAGTSFAPIIKKVAPSVVNIYSSMTIRQRPTSNPFLEDPFFRRFFGEDFGERMQPR